MHRLTAFFLMIMLAPVAARAQAPAGPSAADPSVATQRAIPDARPRDVETLRERPQDRPSPPAPEPVDPSAATVKFDVSRIRFEGSAVLPVAVLAAMAKPYEGRQVTLAELEALARQVRDTLRTRGYLFAKVLIPEQKIEGGAVVIRIYEGRFGEVTVRGNRRLSTRFIERHFDFAKAHGLVHQGQLTRALVVMNDVPGLSLRSVLEPGAGAGTANLVLVAREARAVRGSVDYNNFGARLVGRNRVGAGVSVWSALTGGDELTVRVTEPFPTESDPIYQAAYGLPVRARGDRLQASYVMTKTRVGGAFAALDSRGEVELCSLSYTRALARQLESRSSLTAALTAKTIKNLVFGDQLLSQDDLRILSVIYSFDESRRRSRTVGSVAVNQGLGTALGGRPNGDPLSSRVGSGNTFTKFTADVLHLVSFDPKNSLILRAAAQTTTQELTVAELFAIGGADSVRGFVQSEYLGDFGHSLSAEYRYLAFADQDFRLQLVAFADYAEASLKAPQPGEVARRDLLGAGVGIRSAARRLGTTRADIGFPLSADRSIEGDEVLLYAQHVYSF